MIKPLAFFAAAVLVGAALPVRAQFGTLLDRFKPGSQASAPASPPLTEPTPLPGSKNSTSAAIVDGKPPVGSARGVTPEIRPDRQCNQPLERFNVMDKAVEYGGTEASLRLRRLVDSDYKYNDLTPDDREMLKYVAQTTVWVPVDVESALGRGFELVSSASGETLTESEEVTKQQVQDQLGKLRGAVQDFPGSVKLVVEPKLADGAFAKFGGVIVLSPRFLQTMADKPVGGDLVLAHELSHIYKRHAVKSMQYQMLSTAEGWELGKKLLSRAMKGTQTNALQDGLFMMTTTPKLVIFVRSMQLKFNSNQELEADACAVVWLRAVHIEPWPAWQEFKTAFASEDSKPTLYGTDHPPTAEREENYKAKVSGKAPAGSPAQPGKPAAKPRGDKKPALPG